MTGERRNDRKREADNDGVSMIECLRGAKPLSKISSPSLVREGDKGGRLLTNIWEGEINRRSLVLSLHLLLFSARLKQCIDGAVVQLGERLTGSQKVRGSSPLSSTITMAIVLFAVDILGRRAFI